MWFVLLAVLSFATPAIKLRDPGPPLTEYGKRLAADSAVADTVPR